jgi:hypothetical protein
MADMLPKAAIIKLTGVGLTSGVVNILDVDKNGYFFHSKSLVIEVISIVTPLRHWMIY